MVSIPPWFPLPLLPASKAPEKVASAVPAEAATNAEAEKVEKPKGIASRLGKNPGMVSFTGRHNFVQSYSYLTCYIYIFVIKWLKSYNDIIV